MQHTWDESLIAELRAQLAARTATVNELRNLLAYFVCHMPAQNPLVDRDDPLHAQMMHDAMLETGTLPFEQRPAPESADAPADLACDTTMRGGLERVSASQMLTVPEDEAETNKNGDTFDEWCYTINSYLYEEHDTDLAHPKAVPWEWWQSGFAPGEVAYRLGLI